MVLFYVMQDQQQTDIANNNYITSPASPTHYREYTKLIIAISKTYLEINTSISEHADRHKEIKEKEDNKKRLH
jgi:hypothetical protein